MTTRSVVLAFFPTTARRAPAAGFWPRFADMFRAAATRRQLREMDDRMLADIGISRAEALAEADRAPWDVEPRQALWYAGR